MNNLKILNNKIKRIGDKLEILLNKHDENFKEEILNNIQILMEIEDLEELKEYILNFEKENGKKICACVCLQYQYFMEVSEIVKKITVLVDFITPPPLELKKKFSDGVGWIFHTFRPEQKFFSDGGKHFEFKGG